MRCGLCSMAWRMAYCYGARTSGRSPWGAPRVADRLATELFFLVPFFLNQGVPTLVSVTVLGLGGVLVLSYAGDNFTPTRVTRPPSYSIGPSARTTPPNSHVRCATRRAPPASWVSSPARYEFIHLILYVFLMRVQKLLEKNERILRIMPQ